MALVEAVLTYRPYGLGSDVPSTPLGATADPSVLRLLRDRLLEAARADVKMWLGVDSGVAAVKTAEAERLERVLGVLLPDEELRAELKLVPPRDPPNGRSEK